MNISYYLVFVGYLMALLLSSCVVLDGKMTNEMERMLKEEVIP
jgi:hypothetical protein